MGGQAAKIIMFGIDDNMAGVLAAIYDINMYIYGIYGNCIYAYMRWQVPYDNIHHLLCSEGQLSVVGTHLNDDIIFIIFSSERGSLI